MLRNNVPGGDSSSLRPPAGVEKRAGGPAGRVLIEQLRASIRALEKVPVSLATPPPPGAAPSRPACSLTPSSPANDVSPPPQQSNPLRALRQGGLHEIKPHAYGDMPASLGFALSVIAGMDTSDLVLWCLTPAQAREWGRPYGPGLLIDSTAKGRSGIRAPATASGVGSSTPAEAPIRPLPGVNPCARTP